MLPTLAGPEIGVASTKAFTTQLAVLASLTVALARARGAIGQREAALAGFITEIPSRASEVLNHDERIREIAARSPRPATCSISAAAAPIRWRSRAR